MPKGKGSDLFLSKEFLSNSMEMFSVPSRVSETSSRTFVPKHVNIIDPLKEYNNLGRSVHRGKFLTFSATANGIVMIIMFLKLYGAISLGP